MGVGIRVSWTEGMSVGITTVYIGIGNIIYNGEGVWVLVIGYTMDRVYGYWHGLLE